MKRGDGMTRRDLITGGLLASGALLVPGCRTATLPSGATRAESSGPVTVNVLDFGARPTLKAFDPAQYRFPDEVDNAPAIQRAIDGLPAYD